MRCKRGITGDLAKQLGDLVYGSHAGAERRAPSSGTEPIRNLGSSVCSSLRNSGAFDGAEVSRFARQIEEQLERAAATLDARAAKGFVRRCHGDLHLANVVLWHGRPLLYDAIEFDETIATIDTLYDLAFLLMDLDWHGQRHPANVVLNRYLWRSQDELDLKGLAALPVFLALRAGIRAMVAIDRAAQEDTCARMRDFDRARRYVRAGLDYIAQPAPQLIAIGGLSGTGKSTLGAALAPLVGGSPGAVHFRSDLERKAVAGVGELDRLPASAYTKEARDRIYQLLKEKAQVVLAAGHSVIVDAVYAGEEQRRDIEAAAVGLGIPFHGLWLEADRDSAHGARDRTARRCFGCHARNVADQLQAEVGPISPAWITIDAGGAAERNAAFGVNALVLSQRYARTLECQGALKLHDDPQLRLPVPAALGRPDRRQHQAGQRRLDHRAEPAERRVLPGRSGSSTRSTAQIEGQDCYATVAALPAAPDLAVHRHAAADHPGS